MGHWVGKVGFTGRSLGGYGGVHRWVTGWVWWGSQVGHWVGMVGFTGGSLGG